MGCACSWAVGRLPVLLLLLLLARALQRHPVSCRHTLCSAATPGLPVSKQAAHQHQDCISSLLCVVQGGGGAAAEGMEDDAAADAGGKEEADARSVFVNNVDFGTTPEELQQLFAGCGTVNRVTILADKFGTPKVRAACACLCVLGLVLAP